MGNYEKRGKSSSVLRTTDSATSHKYLVVIKYQKRAPTKVELSFNSAQANMSTVFRRQRANSFLV